MSKPEIAVTLSPRGEIIFLGNTPEALPEWAEAVEVWHSPVDRGLAFRFLKTPTAPALTLHRSGEGSSSARIEAAEFLAKIGFALPKDDHRLFVGGYDEQRQILSTRWEE